MPCSGPCWTSSRIMKDLSSFSCSQSPSTHHKKLLYTLLEDLSMSYSWEQYTYNMTAPSSIVPFHQRAKKQSILQYWTILKHYHVKNGLYYLTWTPNKTEVLLFSRKSSSGIKIQPVLDGVVFSVKIQVHNKRGLHDIALFLDCQMARVVRSEQNTGWNLDA